MKSGSPVFRIICILVTLLFPGTGDTAPAYVQSALGALGSGTAQTTDTVTFSGAETVGNVVVGCVVYYYTTGTPTLNSITDGGTSNNYTIIGTATDTLSNTLKLSSFFALVTTANTVVTATWSSPGILYGQLVVSEVSGAIGSTISNHIEAQQNNPGTAADVISTGAVPLGGADFVFGCSANRSGTGTTAAGTGFTARRNDTVNGNWSLIAEDVNTNGNVIKAATFTDATNGAAADYVSALVGLQTRCVKSSLLGAWC